MNVEQSLRRNNEKRQEGNRRSSRICKNTTRVPRIHSKISRFIHLIIKQSITVECNIIIFLFSVNFDLIITFKRRSFKLEVNVLFELIIHAINV